MSKKHLSLFMGFVIIFVAVIVGILVLFSGGTNTSYAANIENITPTVPNGSKTPIAPKGGDANKIRVSAASTGVAAIQPRILASNSTTPTFTAEDVQQYIKINSVGSNRIASTTQPNIEKIEFITYKELKSKLPGIQLDISEDAIMCFVRLVGDFTITDPSGNQEIFHKARIVFHAQTGNILLVTTGVATDK